VISRAIARDLYSGRALMIFFSRLLLIAGLAPVVAPILGGQLSRIMSWRGIFGVLAGFGAVLLLAWWLGLKETLPPERRIVGGFRRTLHDGAAARHRHDRGQHVCHGQLCEPGDSCGRARVKNY
jgi:DHA1 family bicyclomycin/chloramphenicol resistance-like MFS transporter